MLCCVRGFDRTGAFVADGESFISGKVGTGNELVVLLTGVLMGVEPEWLFLSSFFSKMSANTDYWFLFCCTDTAFSAIIESAADLNSATLFGSAMSISAW